MIGWRGSSGVSRNLQCLVRMADDQSGKKAWTWTVMMSLGSSSMIRRTVGVVHLEEEEESQR